MQSLRLFVGALEARHAMRPLEWRRTVAILLMNGRVSEAEAAKQNIASKRGLVLPQLAPLTSAVDPALARCWTWDTDANVLREQAIDLSHGDHVVVTSSVDCQFCNALASALPHDASLSRAFHDHAIWISRPDAAFDLNRTKDWNARHPGAPLVTVFDLGAWPHPAVWSTPFFYFMHDGVVVMTVQGYVPSRVDEIRAGFRSIGVSLVDR